MMGEPDSEILHLAKAWAEAIVSNDAAAIGSFVADDWVIVGQDGATSKSDFLALIASGDLTHQMMEMVGEGRVRVYGDSAVLPARVINSGHFKGQAFEADEWTTDVFVRSGSRWLCALSHIAAASAPLTADCSMRTAVASWGEGRRPRRYFSPAGGSALAGSTGLVSPASASPSSPLAR